MLLTAKTYEEEKVKTLKEKVECFKEIPKLVIVRVGDDKASEKYVGNKQKMCEKVGIISEVIHLEEGVSNYDVMEVIDELNLDESVTGILLQLPLPKNLNELVLTQTIDPSKDVDGFSVESLGKLISGINSPIACTPKGIVNLLKFYGVELEGKDVLIVNRSNIVGKPLSMLMLKENATPTIAHSKTRDLKAKSKRADIVITAVGKPNFFHWDDFSEHTVVVDVSINVDENGKMCGDVCKDDYEFIHMITPVPGGVGRMTVMALIEQTIEMHERKERFLG